MFRATPALSLAATQMRLARAPMRGAVVGSGPSGFYAASRLLSAFDAAHGSGPGGVEVHMYERLPTPYGLVRYGVAPDHPEVKNVEHKFDQVAHDPRFRFFGNVRVTTGLESGTGPEAHIPLKQLAPYYTHALFAYGASEARHLGVPGSQPGELPHVYAALDFVQWYNGHPDAHGASGTAKSLEKLRGDAVRRVAVVGAGNVALDVLRVLLCGTAQAPKEHALGKTDIPEPVLAALRSWQVESVDIYARRGPAQLAFTNKELREVLGLPHVPLRPVPPALLEQASEQAASWSDAGRKRAMRRLISQLQKGSTCKWTEDPLPALRWGLHFLRSPAAFLGDEHGVHQVRWDVTNVDPETGAAQLSGEQETSDADMVVSSVGYRSVSMQGSDEGPWVPFDGKRNVVPSRQGRVVGSDDQPLPGLYVSGWLATGPVGVIASTMMDAFSVADQMVEDWHERPEHTLCNTVGQSEAEAAVPAAVQRPAQPVVSYGGWLRIDAEERRRGEALGKLREKILTVPEMLEIAQES